MHSTATDVKLPHREIDIAISVNARIGMRSPGRPMTAGVPLSAANFVKSLKQAMKPGAMLHLLEPTSFDFEDAPFPLEYMLEPYVGHGFELVETRKAYSITGYHHVVLRRVEGS